MPTIVVGYDGSAPARHAIRHALSMAEGGRVVVVNAYESPPPTLTSRWRELLAQDHAGRAQSVLDAILLEGDDGLADATWESRIQPGEPAEALVAVAREVDADGIVVASHGYGPVIALLGSVSHDLLRIADRPVTVIPPACFDRATGPDAATE